MKILVAFPNNAVRKTFIPEWLEKKIESLGETEWNTTDKQFPKEVLKEKLRGVDVCISGWSMPQLDEEALQNADRLKLLVHTGGTVGTIVSDKLYDMGVKVLSGNLLYAESVAEGVIAYMLSSLRDIPFYNGEMHKGKWGSVNNTSEGLLDQTVGIVGYGTISKIVINMLKLFRTKIKVYSRYISDEECAANNIQKASLEEIFSTCKIISLHSAQSPSTCNMVNKPLLDSISDGAILINTSRGSIVDEDALAEALASKRFKAVLDVYQKEPLPADSPLIRMDNVLLMPHMAGPTLDRRPYITDALLNDAIGFFEGKPLTYEITSEFAGRMTK